jgi:hypothetical protein
MKRLVVCTGICALIAPASALGFNANFNYVGHVKGQPTTNVGFSVDRSSGGAKRVPEFVVSQIPYTCSDAPPDLTAGWRFKPKMRVQPDRTFAGRGDWVDLPLDPVGTVSGKLRRNGVAVGSFKLRGELAGPGTHCHTGLLDWRTTKRPPLN